MFYKCLLARACDNIPSLPVVYKKILVEMEKMIYQNHPRNRLVLEGRLPIEYATHKPNQHRSSVDERVIFERLWRGALCQAFGPRAPLMARRPRPCCCHCECGNHGPIIGHHLVPPRKALRSVVR